MIQTVLGGILILLHIVCCVLVWLGIKTHLLKGEKISDGTCDLRSFLRNSVRAAFAFANADQKNNRIEPGVEKLRVNEEIL